MKTISSLTCLNQALEMLLKWRQCFSKSSILRLHKRQHGYSTIGDPIGSRDTWKQRGGRESISVADALIIIRMNMRSLIHQSKKRFLATTTPITRPLTLHSL